MPAVDGKDDDATGGRSKVDSVREPIEQSAPRLATPLTRRNCDGSFASRPMASSRHFRKGRAQPRLSTFVPVARFERLGGSLGSKDDPAGHSRSVSFRRTSFHGIADSGR